MVVSLYQTIASKKGDQLVSIIYFVVICERIGQLLLLRHVVQHHLHVTTVCVCFDVLRSVPNIPDIATDTFKPTENFLQYLKGKCGAYISLGTVQNEFVMYVL